MKSYTDLNQSRKLAEILPLESADMCYYEYTSHIDGTPKIGYKEGITDGIPCWSLAALLSVFPWYEINNNGVNILLSVKGEALITEKGECLLDLVVNTIIHLHQLKML